MKKTSYLFFMVTLALMFTVSTPAYADGANSNYNDNNVSKLNNSNSESSLQYVPCPGGGKHTMVGRVLDLWI
ncbi:hypothetical protein KQI49_02290 [Virgibacillus sp. MSJ-26]|uniref:hypothetical protein n=1 Tax=Virgibacillus sp. MSJ-26 TaxID=2841522 RepID=UPI001C121D8C|nr:hypothetical protein [Virgibacillus sp. MSJ-26]MBU5465656.1 hypothetical protein [Virgibacillus sp. MSJ-26]HLQ83071.1 hypothetical protein [Pseudogracilibacillus sp.]